MDSAKKKDLMLLKDFPPHEEVEKRYFLHKSSRPDDIIRLLQNPRHLCCGHKREGRPIFGILRFVAAFMTTAALVVSFVKDLSGTGHVLALGIFELVLALVTILLSLIKHSFKWTKVKDEVAAFADAHSTAKEPSPKCDQKCPGFCGLVFFGVWFFCSAMLIMGFLICHLLDESKHAYLEYTKFSTALTLFICWIVDSCVMESLNDMTSDLTVDKCKLLIHEIKEELYHELRKNGQEERIEQLEKYINSNHTFKIHEEDHILAESSEKAEQENQDVAKTNIEELKDGGLLDIVKKIDNVEGLPNVTFEDPVKDEKNRNSTATPLSKTGVYGSSDAFIVVEIEDVDGIEEDTLSKQE